VWCQAETTQDIAVALQTEENVFEDEEKPSANFDFRSVIIIF
jgi:hypothetical protein